MALSLLESGLTFLFTEAPNITAAVTDWISAGVATASGATWTVSSSFAAGTNQIVGYAMAAAAWAGGPVVSNYEVGGTAGRRRQCRQNCPGGAQGRKENE